MSYLVPLTLLIICPITRLTSVWIAEGGRHPDARRRAPIAAESAVP